VATLNAAVTGGCRGDVTLCCSPGSAAVIKHREGEIDGSLARMGKERRAHIFDGQKWRKGAVWKTYAYILKKWG